MPNWCENKLTIKGKKSEVQRFIRLAEKVDMEEGIDTKLSLANFYPEPDYTRTNVPKAFGRGIASPEEAWWDWRVQNWGTKWDIVDSNLSMRQYKNGNCEATYYFDTAWSPPCAWLKKVGAEWPNLSFKLNYQEGGVGFKGISRCIGGVFEDTCHDL